MNDDRTARSRSWCSAATARQGGGWRSGSQPRRTGADGVAVRRAPRSTGPTNRPGRRRLSAWAPSTSPTIRTSRCRARPTRSAPSPRLAVGNGVRRLVLLSGRGEEEAQHAEQALIASGADWTILRCSWFSQNFSESFLLDGVIAGEVVLPVSSVAEPFVDVDDIADVAVVALTEDGHVGQLYELTGPRLLTFGKRPPRSRRRPAATSAMSKSRPTTTSPRVAGRRAAAGTSSAWSRTLHQGS